MIYDPSISREQVAIWRIPSLLRCTPRAPLKPEQTPTASAAAQLRPPLLSRRVTAGRGCSEALLRRKLGWTAAREVRPDIGSTVAASAAHEARLDIRQANVVRPAIGADSKVMAAVAIDQDAAQPHLAHLAKGDLHGTAVNVRGRVASRRTRHAAIKAAS